MYLYTVLCFCIGLIFLSQRLLLDLQAARRKIIISLQHHFFHLCQTEDRQDATLTHNPYLTYRDILLRGIRRCYMASLLTLVNNLLTQCFAYVFDITSVMPASVTASVSDLRSDCREFNFQSEVVDPQPIHVSKSFGKIPS